MKFPREGLAVYEGSATKVMLLKKFVDLIVFRAGSVILAYCLQQAVLSALYAAVFWDGLFLIAGPGRVREVLRPQGHVSELLCYATTTAACLAIASAISWWASKALIQGRGQLLENRALAVLVNLPMTLQRLQSFSSDDNVRWSATTESSGSDDNALFFPHSVTEVGEGSFSDLARRPKNLFGDDEDEQQPNIVYYPEAERMPLLFSGKSSLVHSVLSTITQAAGIPEEVPITPLFLKLVLLRFVIAAAPGLPAWSAPGMLSASFLLISYSLPSQPAVLHDATPWLLFIGTLGFSVGLVVVVNAGLEHSRKGVPEKALLPSYLDVAGDALLFQLAFLLAMAGDILLEHLFGDWLSHESPLYRLVALVSLFAVAVIFRAWWLDDSSVPRLTRKAGVLVRRFSGWTLCFLASWAARDAVVDLWQTSIASESWHSEHPVTSVMLTAGICTVILGGMNVGLAIIEFTHEDLHHGRTRERVMRLLEQTMGTVMGWSWSYALDSLTSILRSDLLVRAVYGNKRWPFVIPTLYYLTVMLFVLSVGFGFAMLQETRVAALRAVGGDSDDSPDFAVATFNAGDWSHHTYDFTARAGPR